MNDLCADPDPAWSGAPGVPTPIRHGLAHPVAGWSPGLDPAALPFNGSPLN
ncbi:MAG TPA: hypothetical protein VF463_14370 [Sphingobium sp.]